MKSIKTKSKIYWQNKTEYYTFYTTDNLTLSHQWFTVYKRKYERFCLITLNSLHYIFIFGYIKIQNCAPGMDYSTDTNHIHFRSSRIRSRSASCTWFQSNALQKVTNTIFNLLQHSCKKNNSVHVTQIV